LISSRKNGAYQRPWKTRFGRGYIERLNRAELADGEEDSRTLVDLYDDIEKLLIDTERRYIFGQLERGELIDEGRRNIERELDLRETHLQRNTFGASDPEQ